MERAKQDYDNNLERQKERAEVERDRAVIEAQRKDMAEIRELQNELAKVREDKAALEVELAKVRQTIPANTTK